jgi:hypothetical protein
MNTKETGSRKIRFTTTSFGEQDAAALIDLATPGGGRVVAAPQ